MTVQSTIETSLTKLLGIKTPIVAAPMAGASGGALAAQVTLAGGFGFLSAGYDSIDNLRKEFDTVRNILGINEASLLPMGAGFLVWQLEKDPHKGEEYISVALENHVQAIWLSFGADLHRWITYIRNNDTRKGNEDHVKIFIQTSNVDDIVVAITEWKADVIVVQGNEAGGHGYSSSLPILNLFPLVEEVVSRMNGPPLLAAGGLATGSQIASLLTLGASGVVLGTRFLLSPESLYTNIQRQALLDADSSQSTRTMAFDYARNTLGWPQGIDGRGLRNATVTDYEKGEDIAVIRETYANGVKAGDRNRIVVWAGTGVGQMNKIMPAKDILHELHEECVTKLQRIRQLIH